MRRFLTKVCSPFALLAACSFFSVCHAADGEEKPAKLGDLESQMLGYWAPDQPAMMERFKKELPEGQDVQALLPMIKAMLDSMAAEVTKGEVTIHAMGQPQKTTYKVTKTDPATKTLTMTVTDDQGVGEGTAKIEGDKLTLSKDGEALLFNRITKTEYEKRKAAAPAIPGLPGIPDGEQK